MILKPRHNVVPWFLYHIRKKLMQKYEGKILILTKSGIGNNKYAEFNNVF